MTTFRVALMVSLAVLGGRLEAAEVSKHLFILSGQSNMALLEPDESFTPTLKNALGANRVIVVKEALGSQPIRRWYKDWRWSDSENGEQIGDLYESLMQAVGEASAGVQMESVTFVWMQGERDAREGHGSVYASSLHGLIEQIENELDIDSLHVVIGRINDHAMKNESHPDWSRIREAQVDVALSRPGSAWVNTDDLNGVNNDIHATPDGYRILGERFAAAAIELIAKGPASANDCNGER